VLEKTGSAPLSGAAAAALYGTWTYIGTRILNNGIDQFPTAFHAVSDSFPGFVGHTAKAMPGMESENKEQGKRASIVRRLGNAALTHLRRGVTAYTAAGMYLISAGMQGQPSAERRRIGSSLSRDGALVMGLMTTGIAEAVQTIGKVHPGVSEQIQQNAKNPLVWYGLAGAIMLREWWKNRQPSAESEVSN
jgi:hypothetical protein